MILTYILKKSILYLNIFQDNVLNKLPKSITEIMSTAGFTLKRIRKIKERIRIVKSNLLSIELWAICHDVAIKRPTITGITVFKTLEAKAEFLIF